MKNIKITCPSCNCPIHVVVVPCDCCEKKAEKETTWEEDFIKCTEKSFDKLEKWYNNVLKAIEKKEAVKTEEKEVLGD